ncbi:spore cortex biosynthesis protein YabQ [Bacillus sp. 31A1R]|uniref:Spore cortex biosynthesis protein YabQ n=1 Tax=Robertmurraya mangrovi TaxID=3098077 RepID=A0ABU5J4H2_9BACI|nr:spore cortex biosynthesis protein YabQ [Bacillus sp. 31A1R]MDZ5474320.1 spore cortex biosynthesis protein YabQ [Bacillus sp. 31A1R]
MTLSTQFMTMLAMIGMGSYFGASLDTYNRFLKRSKRKSWIVFFNDILFWLLQGMTIFYVLFIVNQGELRFYIFIALLCGFAAYQSLLKQGYLRLLEIVISVIISIYKFLVKMFQMMIFKPIQSIIIGLISLLVMIGKGLLALVNLLLKVILFILRVIFAPVKWIFTLIWKLVPKSIKKLVEKLYDKVEGYYYKIKNTISKWISKLKNRKQ